MVEWKKLGEVANLVRGKVISKDFIRDNAGIYPVYSSQTANDGVLGYIDSYMFDGDFLTWTTDGAYAGTIFRRKGRFNITNVCGLMDITDQRLLQDYLYYWLSLIAKSYVQEGMGNPKLMSNVASTILIPIPSLSEQSRIVSILDTFTSSISNLKQQIEERRKQYEYERDLLLDLEGKEGVEMKKLGEVFSFKNGLNKGKEFFGKGKPIIMFTNVFNSRFITKAMIKSRVDISEQELERINAQIGDVFFTRTSETKEDVGYASVLVEDMEECTFAGFLIRARPITHKMLPQYCKYCFSTPKVRNAIVSKSSFTTRASLTGSGLGEVIIPLPPLSTQSRIVSILDTFEQSISNLEEQLAMREKQYEYYRNQLLTFEGEEERGKT